MFVVHPAPKHDQPPSIKMMFECAFGVGYLGYNRDKQPYQVGELPPTHHYMSPVSSSAARMHLQVITPSIVMS